MNNKPTLCDIPSGSRISRALPHNDFPDCYQFDNLWPDMDALRAYVHLAVHIHNRLGRAYMAIVGPVHSVIVPRMLAQVAHG